MFTSKHNANFSMTNPCLSIVPAGKLGTALQIALICINATQIRFIHTPSFTQLTLPVLTPTKYKAISPLKSNLLCYPVIPSYEFKFFIIISLKKTYLVINTATSWWFGLESPLGFMFFCHLQKLESVWSAWWIIFSSFCKGLQQCYSNKTPLEAMITC